MRFKTIENMCQELQFKFFKFQTYLSCSSHMATISHRKPFQGTAFKLHPQLDVYILLWPLLQGREFQLCLLVVVKAQVRSHSSFSHWLPSAQLVVLDTWTNWS